MSTRARALATAAAVAVLASGCGSRAELLGLRANERPVAGVAALTPAQASSITGRALALAHESDTTRSMQDARAAFTGAALRTAAAAYAVDRALDPATDQGAAALAPAAPASRIVLTAGAAYPRFVLALARQPGAAGEELAVLTSPDARTPYRVASRALLLPRVALPATPSPAPLLSAQVGGLVSTPAAAVRDYAALLQSGANTATTFAASPVTAGVRANAAAQARSVAKVATFTQRHRPTRDPLVVVRTSDGGALVVAAIERVDRLLVRKGAGFLAPPGSYRALAGGLQRITRSAQVTTVQVVVLAVPRTGGGPVRLIAFSELPLRIKAS